MKHGVLTGPLSQYLAKVLFLLGLGLISPNAYSTSAIYDLTADYATNPIGIDSKEPVLSWKIRDKRINVRQIAYQILVSTTEANLKNGIGDMWNTGKVNGDQSVNIAYHGSLLTSRQRCYWKVRIWNNKGEHTEFSEVNYWEMGLLESTDWLGKWISQVPSAKGAPPLLPAPVFRKPFSIPGNKIRTARAYISGLGYYALYINGNRVGDHILDPVLTRYDRRVKYVTYDITKLLVGGENVIGAMLGNGWYNQHTRSAWNFDTAPWRNPPALLCQIEVELVGGEKFAVWTNESWKLSQGPIRFDGIRNGEFYDSRMEMPGWSKKGFDDSKWEKSVEVEGPAGVLDAQVMPPIRIVEVLEPKSIVALADGAFMVDFGQNMAGRIRLRINGESGDAVTVRYGERVKDDGSLDQNELARFIWSGETQTDHYIANGRGTTIWSPSFSYYGFQYVEITGFPGLLKTDDITAEVLATDLTDAGSFSCSNSLFNALHHATRWSFLTNYHGYPTDCPHREKIGWTGDGQVAAEAGIFNFEMCRSYMKWMDDFCDEQQPDGRVSGIIPTSGWGYTYGPDTAAASYQHGYGPQWEGAFVSIPWLLFWNYGDTAVLKQYYEPIRKYVDYLTKSSEGYLLDFGIDDHKPVKVVTDGAILSSGFYYSFVKTLAGMATVLNNRADQERYTVLGDSIKRSFNRKYYNPLTNTYGNGGQTSLGEALYFELVDRQNRQDVLQKLLSRIRDENYHFDAGVLGVKFITNVLLAEGQEETLYRVLNQRDFPSFGNWIERGATTLWQEWDGSRSLNHIMFGSFAEFFYKGLSGIHVDPERPGFKHFFLAPAFVRDVDWVKSSYHSPYGEIQSEWTRDSTGISFNCSIPPNCRATIQIPSSTYRITTRDGTLVDDRDLTSITGSGQSVIALGSGSYRFRFE